MVLLIDCLTCSSSKQLEWQNDVVSTSMRRKSRRIDVNRTSWCGWALTFFNNIPAGVGR